MMAGQWGELGVNPGQYGNGDVAGHSGQHSALPLLKKRSGRVTLPGAGAAVASVSWPL